MVRETETSFHFVHFSTLELFKTETQNYIGHGFI